MSHQVRLTSAARRQLDRLPPEAKARLGPRIADLGTHPRPIGTEKLADSENEYRIRVGNYRLVYRVEDDVLLVLVIAVDHRKDVYRRRR